MNNLSLLGRITKDLELKNTTGTSWLPFTVAVKRKRSSETDFIPVTAFGKTAEIIAERFQKGHRIGLTGRLEITNKKKDGKWETYTSVVIEDFDFIEPKEETKAFERTPYEASAVETPKQRNMMEAVDKQEASGGLNPFTLEEVMQEVEALEPSQEEAIQKMMDFGEQESDGTMLQQFMNFEEEMAKLYKGDK